MLFIAEAAMEMGAKVLSEFMCYALGVFLCAYKRMIIVIDVLLYGCPFGKLLLPSAMMGLCLFDD